MGKYIKALDQPLRFFLVNVFKFLVCIASAVFFLRYYEGHGSPFNVAIGLALLILMGTYSLKNVDATVLGMDAPKPQASLIRTLIASMPLMYAIGMVKENWALVDQNVITEWYWMLALFLGVGSIKGLGLLVLMETTFASGIARRMSNKLLICIGLFFSATLLLSFFGRGNSAALLVFLGTALLGLLLIFNLLREGLQLKPKM